MWLYCRQTKIPCLTQRMLNKLMHRHSCLGHRVRKHQVQKKYTVPVRLTPNILKHVIMK